MQTAGKRARKGNRRRRSKGDRPPRPPLPRKQWFLFFLKWGALAGLVMSAIGVSLIAILFWHFGSDPDLPRISKLDDYRPDQVVRVLSRDGEAVGEIYKKRRTYVSYDRLPEHVIQAFVAAEDAHFFQHEGIDYLGMVRALFINIKSGTKKQGASTITQQVVKNLLLSPERTFKRKFQEIILARRLEQHLSKKEILTLYANEIYFGHGRYGIQEAARYYFGKNVEDLNVGEAAMLAGMPKGPNIYAPSPGNEKRAKDRQTYVLSQMVHSGFISHEEGQKWVDAPIKAVRDPYPTMGDAPEWLEIARKELVDQLGEDEVYKAGGNVVTTLDLKIQRLARQALQDGLRQIDERHGYGHPLRRKVKPDKLDLEALRLARRLPAGGPKPGKVYTAVVREVFPDDHELVVDLGKWIAAVKVRDKDDRYNHEGKPLDKRFAVGDRVRVSVPRGEPKKGDKPVHAERRAVLSGGPEGAVVVIDVASREVLAVVGGYDVGAAQFNRATMAKRQAGSTFKPFVYAAAVDSGDFTAASIVNDTPEVFDLWRPVNYEKGAFEGPVRLRYALKRSINTVAIKVTHDIGPSRVAEVAHSLGIQSDLPEQLSLALGSGGVTPLEMTNAFATFAAGGRTARPVLVKRVGDKVLTPEGSTQAIRPEVAYIILDMMRSVIHGGTGSRASRLGMDLAGKTGTSDDARDCWFIGVSPELALGVWVGFDDFRRSVGAHEEGARAALPVFVELMGKIGKKSLRFSRPPGIVEARIDKKTGLLAPRGAASDTTLNEVFLPGTVPQEVAPAPGEASVDSFAIDQYGDDEAGGKGNGDGDQDQDQSEASP